MQSGGPPILQLQTVKLVRIGYDILVTAAERGKQAVAASYPMIDDFVFGIGQARRVRENQKLVIFQGAVNDVVIRNDVVGDTVRLQDELPTPKVALILVRSQRKTGWRRTGRIVQRKKVFRICRIQNRNVGAIREGVQEEYRR